MDQQACPPFQACIVMSFGEAGLSETDRRLLWGRQFLNPFAFYDLENGRAFLKDLARAARE